MLKSGTPIYRNPLYRARRVRVQALYPSTNSNTGKIEVGGKANTVDVVELTEVTSFSVEASAGTAVSMGVLKAVIQPWYFGPSTITIVGKSHIGAYTENRVNYNTDDDVQKLLQYSLNINDTFLWGDNYRAPLNITGGGKSTKTGWDGGPNGLTILLSIYDPENMGKLLGISSQYKGFIDSIQYVEDEANPYVLIYTIKFIGQLAHTMNIDDGKLGLLDDFKKWASEKWSGLTAKVPKVGDFSKVPTLPNAVPSPTLNDAPKTNLSIG